MLHGTVCVEEERRDNAGTVSSSCRAERKSSISDESGVANEVLMSQYRQVNTWTMISTTKRSLPVRSRVEPKSMAV